MKIATTQLKSISALSFSRQYDVPKLEREQHKDYEDRTWRERCHVNKDGFIIIPPMMFKNCMSMAAKFLSLKIPGVAGGKSTYTKNIEAGILVMDELVLPIKKEDVAKETLNVPSDGRRGGTTRVTKHFPLVPEWEGEVKWYILDEIITKDVFIEHLKVAGQFIGIGRFRPRNNGYYGRFNCESCVLEDSVM